MAKKEILVGYGVDIDAVAGWLGSYGGGGFPVLFFHLLITLLGPIAGVR